MCFDLNSYTLASFVFVCLVSLLSNISLFIAILLAAVSIAFVFLLAYRLGIVYNYCRVVIIR